MGGEMGKRFIVIDALLSHPSCITTFEEPGNREFFENYPVRFGRRGTSA
jgi:hypothetical protein